MKRKHLFMVLALVTLFAVSAWAANTVTTDAGTIKIVPDGTTDWAWTSLAGANANGLVVYSIQFNPSAANDVLILHNGGIDGVEVFNSGPAGGTAPIIKYYPQGKVIRLVFDASDCTFSVAANASIFVETN